MKANCSLKINLYIEKESYKPTEFVEEKHVDENENNLLDEYNNGINFIIK